MSRTGHSQASAWCSTDATPTAIATATIRAAWTLSTCSTLSTRAAPPSTSTVEGIGEKAVSPLLYELVSCLQAIKLQCQTWKAKALPQRLLVAS